MTTVLLIRHADNDFVGHTIVGWRPGVPLNARGCEQAERLAERLAGTPICAVYSSPLERATQTAEPLARRLGLEVSVVEAIGEIRFGDWTGKRIGDLASDPAWKRFNLDRANAPIPGGERMVDVEARMVAFLDAAGRDHNGGTIAAVSHGDPIRAVLCHYLGMPLDLVHRLEVQTGSVSVVELSDWGPRVLRINDTGELP